MFIIYEVKNLWFLKFYVLTCGCFSVCDIHYGTGGWIIAAIVEELPEEVHHADICYIQLHNNVKVRFSQQLCETISKVCYLKS